MNNKYILFLENAKFLNTKFKIIPLLYGSLGLEVLTDSNFNSEDIDILIPKIYLDDLWNSFKLYLENCGYKLIDLHEHTFEKDKILYSYASIENLKEFANIDINEIQEYEDMNCKYKMLNLQQYLKVYKESAKDGYRINKKEKQDMSKIIFIKKKLSKED